MKQESKCALCLLLVPASLFLWSGCKKDAEKLLKSTDEELAAVKVIDGYDVPMELYRYVAMNYKNDFEDGQSSEIWLGAEGQALLDELNANVDETLISLYTPLTLCREYGIDPDDAYIKDALDATMDDIYEGYDYDYELYRKELDSVWMTDGVYRFLMRNDILEEELLVRMADKGEFPVDDAAIRKIVESDDFIRVKQILVSADNGKTPEENRARAEELLELAKQGGDFDELVQKYGADLNMFNNPDGYYITRGSFYQEFEEAAFALDVDEISDVVETPAGFSILKRCEKEAAYLDAHFDELADSYISSQFNLLMEARESTLTVSDTDKLKEYSIFNLSMDE